MRRIISVILVFCLFCTTQVFAQDYQGNMELDENHFTRFKFSEEYELIVTNEFDKINTNKETMPSNSNIYPYTLTTVDKSVYEIPFYKPEGEKRYIDPISVYERRKAYYPEIAFNMESYMDGILNIDYNTITKEDLISRISSDCYYRILDEDIDAYINYVKTNKIKITGTSHVQMPILYYDGLCYRVRTKIEFSIDNAIVKENLLLGDLNSAQKISYSKDKYSLIVDIPTGFKEEKLFLYVLNMGRIQDMIAGSIGNGKL